MQGGWVISLKNAGEATSPRSLTVATRVAGQPERLESMELFRGLEPGEELILTGGWQDPAELVVDPAGEIAESDEANNALKVPGRRTLICTPR